MEEPLESSTVFESVVIVAQLTFSLPLHLPKCLGWYHADLPSSVGQPFSAAHFFWALLQANSCVRQRTTKPIRRGSIDELANLTGFRREFKYLTGNGYHYNSVAGKRFE
jgi:hypothetical protein